MSISDSVKLSKRPNIYKEEGKLVKMSWLLEDISQDKGYSRPDLVTPHDPRIDVCHGHAMKVHT